MEVANTQEKLLYDALLCSRCKFCTTLCPTYDGWLGKSPVGRIQAILYTLNHKKADFGKLGNIFFSCTLCGACEEICKTFMGGVKIKEIIELARSQIVERADVPAKIKEFLENIYKYGNPYGIPGKKREDWANGLDINVYSNEDFLFFVGCVGSFDPIGQKVARSFSELMIKERIPFGILGKEEKCDGNEANILGEKGLFELLEEENIEKFKNLGIRKIVTNDPHAYNAFKNEYTKKWLDFEVVHHTQFIWELIKSGKLTFNNSSVSNTKVTYHDPCFLGRWNGIYEEPRNILHSIPGVTVVEMERNRQNSFCCGGGSGNFYTDLSSEGIDPARERIKEAYKTGAEIIVTACPTCAIMLGNALEEENLERKLVVKDISEVVIEHLS